MRFTGEVALYDMGNRYSTSPDGGARGGLETVGPVCVAGVAVIWNHMPSCWYAFRSAYFFAISGANKLFVAGSTQTMYETPAEAKVPFPHLMSVYFVSGVEFPGGSLLTAGLLSSLACLALLVDMLVAILTTSCQVFRHALKGLSPS